MATFELVVDRRQSLAFHGALTMALFYLGNALPDTPVHVKVATLAPQWDDGSLPDQLSLVIQDDSGWETDVVLNRARYIEPNIPVYTYCGGHKGGSDFQLSELEDNQNMAYYQSTDHGAAIQVTQVETSEHQVNFLLSGELVVNGTRCSLTHGDEVKRALRASDDLVYTLHELPPLPDKFDDVITSTEPHLRELQSQASRMASDFSPLGGLSKTLYSRNTKYEASDVYVDMVIVADNARYLTFTNRFGSRKLALQKMREYFTSTVNGMDAVYQGSAGRQHSIHIRLVKLFVDETPSSGWWSTEQFHRGSPDWIDGDKALNHLEYCAANYENPFLPYDHLMVFSGYDLVYVGSGNNHLIGMATLASVCLTRSVSIVEDIGYTDIVLLAAHELGHSLSAYHDGIMNSCDPTSDTMAAGAGAHQTRFSACSAIYFNNFINDRLQSPEGQKCLLQQLPVRSRRSTFGGILQEEDGDQTQRLLDI